MYDAGILFLRKDLMEARTGERPFSTQPPFYDPFANKAGM